MAKIEAKGLEKYISALSDLTREVDDICKMAVYDGAKIVANAVRAEYNHIEHPYHGVNLIDHMGLSSMRNQNGFINTKLGFSGYLSDGRPAAVVARAMESGNSHQKKKPFMRQAVRKTENACIAAMDKKVDELMGNLMKKQGG